MAYEAQRFSQFGTGAYGCPLEWTADISMTTLRDILKHSTMGGKDKETAELMREVLGIQVLSLFFEESIKDAVIRTQGNK